MSHLIFEEYLIYRDFPLNRSWGIVHGESFMGNRELVISYWHQPITHN